MNICYHTYIHIYIYIYIYIFSDFYMSDLEKRIFNSIKKTSNIPKIC